MPIPPVSQFRIPLFQFLGDGQPRSVGDAAQVLARQFNLTDAECRETISSGYPVVRHRIVWAGFHLRKAGLLKDGVPGLLQITPEGKSFLATKPQNLKGAVLRQFPQYREWEEAVSKSRESKEVALPDEEDDLSSPAEQIAVAHAKLSANLAAELQMEMARMDPFRFEQLVVDLLFAMGYGGSREEAARVTKKTGDEGIDGVINEDRLGLDVIYIQAKRWKSNVGRIEIQSFVGALAGQQAHKGIFITTSDFGQNAVDYARSVPQKVILINGTRLAELMIEHDIGVAITRTVAMKRIDSDYFAEA